MPSKQSCIVDIQPMNYIVVRGKGNPLEGFWWQDGISGIDYADKESFNFISLIRLPDFVKKEDFDWAADEAVKKKKIDFSKVELLSYNEGNRCAMYAHRFL